MFRKLPPDYISLTINSGAFKLGLIVSHKIIGGFFPECEGLSTMHFSLLSKKKNHKTFLIKQRNPISFIKFIIWHCILCLIKVPLNGKGRGRRIGSPVNLIRGKAWIFSEQTTGLVRRHPRRSVVVRDYRVRGKSDTLWAFH